VINQEQAEAVRVLHEQEQALREIDTVASSTSDYVLGSQRLNNWFSKTRQLMTEYVSETASSKLTSHPMVTNLLYPDRSFNYKIAHYRSVLIALQESIVTDGLRFLRPQPNLELAVAATKVERDSMNSEVEAAKAAIAARLKELTDLDDEYGQEGSRSKAYYQLPRWKIRAVDTLRHHLTTREVEYFEEKVGPPDDFLSEFFDSAKGILAGLLADLEAHPEYFFADVKNNTNLAQEQPMARKKPRVFIGSSGEGVKTAQIVQLLLDYDYDCEIWNQGAFSLTKGNLENLVEAMGRFDFAILILTGDDLVTKRDKTGISPRDNVLFELGLFIGALGRERTFMLSCSNDDLELPSDLAGVTPATYRRREDGNLRAALGAACTQIRLAIEGIETSGRSNRRMAP